MAAVFEKKLCLHDAFRSFVVLFLLLFVFASQLSAQQIEGLVLTEDGQKPLGAVLALRDVAGRVIDQTTLTLGPRWSMRAPSKGLYQLQVYLLGYAACDTLLQLTADTLHLSILLRRQVFELSGVEVVAFRPAVRIMGDTVRYEVERFLQGNERNLEELLNSMPGVEVSEDKQIFFYGKRVDVLLIDGHNVLNNQHRLALESVQIDKLQSIDFIRNYKDKMEADEITSSELTAMDMHLKEEAKGELSGNIQALATADSRYKLHSDLLNVNDGKAYTIFGRSNNLAEPVLSAAEYMGLQSSLSRAFGQLNNSQNRGGEVDILPPEFVLGDDIRFAKDALLAGNGSFFLGSASKLRFSLLGARLLRDRSFYIQRHVLADGSFQQGSSENWQLSKLGDASIAWEWQAAAKWLLSMDLHVHLKDYISEDAQVFEDPLYRADSRYLQEEPLENVDFSFKLKYRAKEDVSYKLSVFAERQRKTTRDRIWSSDTLFLPASMSGWNSFFYEQLAPLVHDRTELTLARNDKTKLFHWGVQLRAYTQHEALPLSSFLPQDAEAWRQTRAIGPRLSFSATWPQWKFEGQGRLEYMFLNMPNRTFAFAAPSTRLALSYYLQPHVQHDGRFSLSWAYDRQPAAYALSNGYLLIQDSRSLLWSQIRVEESLSNTHRISFSFSKVMGKFPFLSALSWLRSKPGSVSSPLLSGNYWVSTYELVPQSVQTLSAQFYLLKLRLKSFSSSAKLSFSYGDFLLRTNPDLLEKKQYASVRFGLSLERSFWDDKLKATLRYQGNFRKNIGLLTGSDVLIQHVFLGLRLKLNDYWAVDCSASRAFQKAASLRAALGKVDVNVEYALQGDWFFFLQGQSLNRLRSREFVQLEQNINYLEYKTYLTLPGYVGLGLRKEF